MKRDHDIKIIKNPRITEKASSLTVGNVYVFDVTQNANKQEVAKAVKAIYKVTPVKVNILAIPKKNTRIKGKVGTKGGGKKAVVFLKTGDKIEIL